MSKIAKAVQGFLKSMEWQWQEMDANRYRVIVHGNTAHWVWITQWDEDESFFTGYSYSPVNVPANRRAAAAEYLTRANWRLRLGNFELDYTDGEVCFRTSMVMESIRPTVEMMRRLAFASFQMMDQYLPGLMSVIYGKASPKAAIEEAERPKEQKPQDEDEDEEEPQGPEQDAATAAGRNGRAILTPRKRRISRTARVAQFAQYLKLMNTRTHDEAQGSCFMVIAQPFEPEAPDPDEALHGRPKTVQFCFEDKWFAVDITNTCLAPEDAARILGERRGFYREAENPGAGVTTKVSDLVEFDPIGRKYIYGDEDEAAQDVAYVLYDVWGLDPQAELLVTASAFEGPSWEKNAPLK